MKKSTIALFALALLPLTGASAGEARQSFGFQSADISGANGSARLSGGGSYDPVLNEIRAGGAFQCTSDINQGLLAGCKAGQGVRWDAAGLLTSSGFKCTSNAAEAGKTGTTGDSVVVLVADFYKQGDGDMPFTSAKMIVSATDLKDDVGGTQKVWIQSVGCGDGEANFN